MTSWLKSAPTHNGQHYGWTDHEGKKVMIRHTGLASMDNDKQVKKELHRRKRKRNAKLERLVEKL